MVFRRPRVGYHRLGVGLRSHSEARASASRRLKPMSTDAATTSLRANRKPRRGVTPATMGDAPERGLSTPRKSVARRSATQKPVISTALRLPFSEVNWLDGQYIAPIALLRSALFSVSPKGARRQLNREALATLEGFELRFSGEILDQTDEDVWLVMLRQAREHGMGLNVHFTLRSLLKELNWDICGKSAQRLRSSFLRLANSSIEMESPDLHYVGHLIEEIMCDKKDGEHYYFRLSPRMAAFFGRDQYAYLGIEQRVQIKGVVAKWLHGYIEAHPRGFPTTVDHLWKLSGSTTPVRKRFIASLRSALEELKQCGVIESWRIADHITVFAKRATERERLTTTMIPAR